MSWSEFNGDALWASNFDVERKERFLEIRDWAVIGVGLLSITGGALMIRKRDALARFNSDMIRSRGGKLNSKVADSSTGSTVGFVGAGAISIGVILILRGVFQF